MFIDVAISYNHVHGIKVYAFPADLHTSADVETEKIYDDTAWVPDPP